MPKSTALSTSPSPETRFGSERSNRSGGGGRTAVPGRRGRPPKLVREAYRLAFDESLEFLKKIRDCHPSVRRRVQVATPLGRVVTITVEPSLAERVRAVEVMGKYSGVATLRAEDERPDPPPPSGFDLTQLSVKQLAVLEQLLTAAESKPVHVLASGTEVHTK